MDGPALLVLTALAVPLAACTVGTTTDDVRPARSPHGVTARVTFGDGPARPGELLEVRGDGLLLLVDDEVVMAPWATMERVRFLDAPGARDLRDGRAPTPEQRERLRLLSRYAYGLSQDGLERLLASVGQGDLRIVRDP